MRIRLPLSGLIMAIVAADVVNGRPAAALCVAAGVAGFLLAVTVAVDRLWLDRGFHANHG